MPCPRRLSAGLAAGLVLSTAPAMVPPAAAQVHIRNPELLSPPSAERLGEAYPAAAELLGVSGRVRMTCVVTAAGALRDCAVTETSTPGLGFEAAALDLAADFVMAPMRLNDVAADGARVTIPLFFAAPSPEPVPAYAGPPPSAAAMAAAGRLLAVTPFPGDLLLDEVADLDVAAREELLQLFGAEIEREQAALNLAFALALARSLPEATLVAAAQGEPATLYRALDALEDDAPAFDALDAGLSRVQARVRAAYCARHGCLDVD